KRMVELLRVMRADEKNLKTSTDTLSAAAIANQPYATPDVPPPADATPENAFSYKYTIVLSSARTHSTACIILITALPNYSWSNPTLLTWLTALHTHRVASFPDSPNSK